MSIALQIALALALLAGGAFGGIEWQLGRNAIAAQAAAKLQKQSDDLKRENEADQRRLADKAAGQHAATLAVLNTKLGAAYATIAKIPDRDCLDPATVSMLNNIGAGPTTPVATPPGQSPGTTSSTTPAGGLRFSTNVDSANGYAYCRAQYAEVNSQLNQILDIEDKRFPLPK